MALEKLKPGICGVIARLGSIKGDIQGMTTNSDIGTVKSTIDTLVTDIDSNGWLLNPSTSAVTTSETLFQHSGGTGGDNGFNTTGTKAYFSGDTWSFSGSSGLEYLSAQISRLDTATTGSTQLGFTGNQITYTSTTADWFTGWTRTPGTTNYTGMGFNFNVSASTSTDNNEGGDNHAVMSGITSGFTTLYSATTAGNGKNVDNGRDRLRILSTQLTTIQSQKNIKNTIVQIRKNMIEELERISLIMREGSNWNTFPFDCGGQEGISASEKRIEKEFRKTGGVKLTGGQTHSR